MGGLEREYNVDLSQLEARAFGRQEVKGDEGRSMRAAITYRYLGLAYLGPREMTAGAVRTYLGCREYLMD
jgi:hypothetical protein